jgi:DNA polymerase III subunit delta
MAATAAPGTPVHLLKGSDEVLLREAVVDLVNDLVGDDDRSLLVEDLDVDRYLDGDDVSIRALVDAAQTPPFLTDRRVVVARHVAMFAKKEAIAPLVAYLADPLPTTTLVLVWERDPRPNRQAKLPAVPKSLADAVKAAKGLVVDTTVSDRGKDREGWFEDQIRQAGLKLDKAARAHLVDQLSGDPGRLQPVLAALVSTFGEGASLGRDDIEPYVGEASDVKPWDLTDAIDKGDASLAIDKLHRMTSGGTAHPLQILALLHNHYTRMLRLDGSDARGEAQAAALLGMKGSTYPARKALETGRRLGSERLHQFIGLLAEADLDLRGAKAWPPDAVVEVLVARLASRSRSATRR